MRYLMLIKHDERYRHETIPAALMEAMGVFVGAAVERGVMVETAGLKPTNAGHRIRLTQGHMLVTDGPFIESKEVIAGYALMELPSEAEARAYARQFVQLHIDHWPEFECECEIRPVEDGGVICRS